MAKDIYKTTSQDRLSLEELRLYHQIMDYRAEEGLDAIPLSASLTLTSGRHVVDIRENFWAENREPPSGANLHSWSDAPYMADGSTPRAMWEAPERLGTDYPGYGYEILAAGQATSAAALDTWKNSEAHNDIITNQDSWASLDWNAIGIGLDRSSGAGPYAGRVYTVWFGTETDPAGAPVIQGTGDDDRATLTDFADIAQAGRGDDTISGGRGGDRISGGDGDDRLNGDRGNDRLSGGNGADRLSGGKGNDTLFGGAGDDQLLGGTGADRLSGGPGADRLTGGAGADVFVFSAASHSPASRGARDVITDFDHGVDRIELSAIDANTERGGHQDFNFIGGAAFSDSPGELRNASGLLSGDTDGDGRADFQIDVGTNALTADDFIL